MTEAACDNTGEGERARHVPIIIWFMECGGGVKTGQRDKWEPDHTGSKNLALSYSLCPLRIRTLEIYSFSNLYIHNTVL